MVAASDSLVKIKVLNGKKVSKPLMEKKRRARINKCLDQLKSLLENCYSNNIRKRKLEKADILELTVKHLRHLQKFQSGPSVNSDIADYQAGFRSCLAGVNQYLLMADSSGSSNMLTHLSSGLLCLGGRVADSSTVDSDTAKAVAPYSAAQRLTQTTTQKASAPCPSNSSRNNDTEVPGRISMIGEFSRTSTNNMRENRYFNQCYSANKNVSISQRSNNFVGALSHYWRPW